MNMFRRIQFWFMCWRLAYVRTRIDQLKKYEREDARLSVNAMIFLQKHRKS